MLSGWLFLKNKKVVMLDTTRRNLPILMKFDYRYRVIGLLNQQLDYE